MQRLAAQHQEERRKLDIIKKAEAEQLMADNLRQIDETHHMKEIHKLQDEVSLFFLVTILSIEKTNYMQISINNLTKIYFSSTHGTVY